MRWRLIMDSGAFAPNIVLRSLPDNTMDYDLMDELVYDGFWLETTDGFGFWQPGLSTSSTSNFNPGIFPYCETEMSNLIPTLHDGCYKEEAEGPDFLDNPTLVHPQIEKLAENEEHDGEVIQTAPYSSQFESFLVEPGATPSPTSSLRKRLIKAIEYLKESTRNRDILIQMWVPMNRGGRHVLTTNNQPFSVNENCKSLAKYRDVCRSYQFAAEEDSKELVGLLSRVFLKMLPEWTPDVRFFRKEEYPRIGYARQYNVSGSVALPLFEEGSGTCLGVVEIVTTTQNLSYRPEFENVLKALEAVNLRSSGILYPPKMKDCDESYKAALAEIKEVLKSVCNMHKLPLTQTWAPCTQQGKCGCQNSDQNRARCISIVDSACYVPNEQLLGFHEACSEHHLLGGEGVSGGAFITNQQCFSTDISAFSKTEYPLSHHARMFGLRAAVAIRLRSIYTGSADFVLEFFLPVDWKDSKEQKNMLSSLSSVIQQVSQSLRLVTDQELAEENLLPGRETFAPVGYRFEEDDIPTLVLSPSREAARDEPSWIAHMMEAQRKGLGTAVSLGYHKTEPVDGFKVTTHWDYNEPDWRAFSDHKQYQQDSGRKGIVEGRSAGERRRTKTEGTINLQVLRQYFSGSLKDAAKNIGVCPTTLKRICRQHGITRWPSRKIKKVGHSLKKLQLVIDSVQGAEGAIQLSSFYTNFPQLSSPSLTTASPFSSAKMKDHMEQLNTRSEGSLLSLAMTSLKSQPSSFSHSSNSSLSRSTGPKQLSATVNASSKGDVLTAEQAAGVLKRAYSGVGFHDLCQEETKFLIKPHSRNLFTEHPSSEALPSLPKSSSQVLADGGAFRVKATFGEEKVRFRIPRHWGFEELRGEIVRRFNAEGISKIDLKYLDDDSEWVLLTCDADLEECIDIYRSSSTHTIKLSLHQNLYSDLGSSFGSNGPS